MSQQESSVQVQQRRLALIVGQNDYSFLSKLELSINDANLVDRTLQQLGFTTTLVLNQTNSQLKQQFFEFSEKIHDGDLVFFYYSGHAGQQTIDNKVDNYLFGIDAHPEKVGTTTTLQGIPLMKRILKKWFIEKSIYLIVLDACREFPDPNSRYKSGYSRNNNNIPILSEPHLTLAPAWLPEDMNHRQYDIVYACQPGYGAIEKTEGRKQGYLATALCKAMSKPGSWSDALVETISQVQKETHNHQIPSVMLNVGTKLHFIQEAINTHQQQQQKTNPNLPTPTPTLPTPNLPTPTPTLPTPTPTPPIPNLNPTPTPTPPIPNLTPTPTPTLPQLTDAQLTKVSVGTLQKKIKNGFCENLSVQFGSRFFDIRGIPDVGHIVLKGLKLVSRNSMGCEYLIIELAPDQTLRMEDCVLEGIGLMAGGLYDDQRQGKVVLNKIKVSNAPDLGIWLKNVESAQLGEVDLQNCRQSGCAFKNITDVNMQNSKVLYCSLGLVCCNNIKQFEINAVNVEDGRRQFWLKDSSGIVKNCNIRNCTHGLYVENSQVKFQNVNEC